VLDDRTVTQIAATFELGADAHVDGDPERGEMGRIWPVRTDRGRWAVKEPFELQTESEEQPNATFAALVRSNGVATPDMIRTGAGTLLADIGERQYRVYSWLDMAGPDPGVDPRLVGDLVARLHRVRVVRAEAVDPWYTDPVGADRWQQLAEDLIEAGCSGGRPLADHVDELARLEATLEPPSNLQVCHRDLWADNVRAMPAGGLCVFDWDDAGSCDPSHELAAVLFEYARGSTERARALVAAYRSAGGPARIAGPQSFSMAIAQLGHIGERAGRMWLEATGPAERDRAEANLAEFLDAPLTTAGIDLLVRAAAEEQSAGA
jgi:Ser/Thr protein kinase RdoA (MazF antagonist)